jgi:hypothetical protein
VVIDPKDKTDKDPPIDDDSTEDPNDEESNFDDPIVVKDTKDKTEKDQPIDDDSTEDPNDDEFNFDDPIVVKDLKDKTDKANAEKNKNVNTSGIKRKCSTAHRELGKLQDSLSKNEIIPKGKKRCAK